MFPLISGSDQWIFTFMSLKTIFNDVYKDLYEYSYYLLTSTGTLKTLNLTW